MVKQKSIVIGVILIVVSLVIISNTNILPLSSVSSQSTFVKPSWARLECAPTDSYEKSFSTTLDKQDLFKCNGFTLDCRFKIKDNANSNCLGLLKPSGLYDICDLSGENCYSGDRYNLCDGEETPYKLINVGQSIKFNTGIFTGGESRTKITFEYKPWSLYRFVGGSKSLVNAANCDITTSEKAKIRSVDYPGSKLYRQGGEGQKWINYVDDWFYGPGTNVYTYQGKDVYCSNAKLYTIVDLIMADGSIKKLDPTYEKTLPDGDVLKGLGSFIKNVECCPNEPNCNDNFERNQGPTECFTDIQCLNAGGPVPADGTSYVYERCVESQCKQFGPVHVECTNNAYCPNGEVCDLSTTNYGQCIKQTTAPYCGDGKCDALEGETKISCSKDCGEQTTCKTCFDWLFSKTKSFPDQCTPAVISERIWWNPLTWIIPKDGINQNQTCPLFLLLGGIAVALIIYIIVLIVNKQNRRSKKR